ncbi:MAG: glycosyltransferase [Bacillus sp. (in: Bacteria)]|nr:glycosyltransferase [Bacillus sp. (in: firmicutes)]MCM1426738.1 glycosyltransferase [Eubacterium sp.]
MRQLQSYLDRQNRIGNVLILGAAVHMQRASSVTLTQEKEPEKLRSIIKTAHIDSILFMEGWTETVKQIADIPIRYLIGQTGEEEDYFGLWERYRMQAEHIYILRNRTGRLMRDMDRYEVLEWERTDAPLELSVIIPVYNVCGYLGQCLESLTEWKAPYVEYLFVDDGSTDGSTQLLEDYAAKDGRIRHLRKKNGGCASARNLGLCEAKGRYIGFVDGDDFIAPEMFKKLLKRALMGGYELAYCGYQEYDEAAGSVREVRNDCMEQPYLSGTYRADQVQKLMIKTRVAIWRCIYKKELLEREKIAFHESLPRFDDLPFKIESGFCAKSAVCVPEYLYYYRLGRQGQDVSCTDERLFVHFEIFHILDEWVTAMKDRRLLDYLQVIKLHTHGYALGKIDRQYYRNYLKKAGAQMDVTAKTMRTLVLMLLYGGKSNLWWYLKSRKVWLNG